MGVHPRKRELERCDPVTVAGIQQRRPGLRRVGQCLEVELSEADVEPAEELRGCERAVRTEDRLGHGEVQASEARDSVSVGETPRRSPAFGR